MFKTVIGLEIHAQLSTPTKAFCSCPADTFGDTENTAICPVCTGQPGTIPLLGKETVRLSVMSALALNCEISEFSFFDRKNYFYPDLPKGYQITQFFKPLARNGFIEFRVGNGQKSHIRINRIHIEEDAGKTIHEGASSISAYRKQGGTLVDLNRCGIPLVEIVTEPDITSCREARLAMESIRDVLRYIGVCSGDMEKGALRCDANISIVDTRSGRSSNRVEVKNINSFRFVERALEYEYKRITQAMKDDEEVLKETRTWDFGSRSTISMRTKEEESDYRYFPEPDLPALRITRSLIEEVKKQLPELPEEKIDRFIRDYALPEHDAVVLVSDKELSDFFEEAARVTQRPKEVSKWLTGDLLRILKERNITVGQSELMPDHVADLLKLLDSGTISISVAKEIFPECVKLGKMPSNIVEEKGLQQVDNEEEIETAIRQAMEENPRAVNQYRSGKKAVLSYFIGAVMKRTKGRADPAMASSVARRLLEDD